MDRPVTSENPIAVHEHINFILSKCPEVTTPIETAIQQLGKVAEVFMAKEAIQQELNV